MLTILLSRCRCCPFTPAASDSASASADVAVVVVVASSALAARLNGRGLRFLKRKRNSVFRTRIAASHTPRQIHNYLSMCMCMCTRTCVYRGERRDGGMGHGNWSKRINDSQINYNVYIDIDIDFFFLFQLLKLLCFA